MQDLYSYARADGIKVPIFHNDYWFKGDWSKQVDLYAFDSYPYGFSCCHQWWDTHFQGIDTWEHTLRSVLNINTPMFVSELQGGAFDPWGGSGTTPSRPHSMGIGSRRSMNRRSRRAPRSSTPTCLSAARPGAI